VAQTVAYAFGLAEASFFPAIVMGIFSKRMNGEGAISGMVARILFTAAYIISYTYLWPEYNNPDGWFLGISPEGIGFVLNIVQYCCGVDHNPHYSRSKSAYPGIGREDSEVVMVRCGY